ncbi:putative tyrosine-protein phosphatase [Podospora australis]|uniref:protein-tyrosine-phosphatase n=1 Tax=Podospora australis TaxID=1536484 RepID=A0AAN6WK15_9PEZI|nr:putative tyrosine-protein phosphatase [Podospora australis]
MPPEQRTSDRTTSYYTMKTSSLTTTAVASQGHGHTRTNSQSYFTNRPTTTPLASPRPPSTVGQSYAPKLSPGAGLGLVQDARTPSPNYFGLAVDNTAVDPRDSALMPHENWSSPTSSVKSFAAAIPKHLPLDANPEFEAFRRQVDATRGRSGFSLSTTHFNITSGGPFSPAASTPSALQRPRPPRWHTHGSELSEAAPTQTARLESEGNGLHIPSIRKTDPETDSMRDSAYMSADSKSSSRSSLYPPFFLGGLGRSQSPLAGVANGLSRKTGTPSPTISSDGDTSMTPSSGTTGPTFMPPYKLKDLLEKDDGADVLLLDIRVSPQFAQGRVRGALNLCIPTTLLKRATFNLQKLQQTFQADRDQDKFANWQNISHLVVYDAASSDKRDATSAINMIKKFTNEGYSGTTSILSGGFSAFAAAYPNLVDRSSNMASQSLSLGASSGSVPNGLKSGIPPVIGGVMLPTAMDKVDPFFSNIRQNQDLVDGVGQMDVGVPSGLKEDNLPRWLREAVEASDHGKKVSDKFLRIELSEQSRMKDAYSAFNPHDARRPPEKESAVQLSGIEKGGKNRYKDILPFEHARVKLQGRPNGACDYVNASHIHASRSYKRYIASQGPLPATFEDFWSVVWDNDVRVIVMLTAESEGGQLKCHPYWKGRDFGPIRLRVLSEKKISLDIDKHRPGASPEVPATETEQNMVSSKPEGGRRRANTTTTLHDNQAQPNANSETPYVTIRKFALSHAAHPFAPIREITHLHYTSWPDFGAPAQPSHLLALVELANVMQRASMPNDSTTDNGRTDSTTTYFDRGVDGREPSGFGQGGIASRNWYEAPESNEHARPMLVHCSAGCGRTGTFCTVDSVIDMLKRQRMRPTRRSNSNKRAESRQGDLSRVKRPALDSDRDSDGDVSMDENPIAARFVSTVPPTTATGNVDRGIAKRTPSHRGIDTTWMQDDSADLIALTVEDFREQRLSMVQSLRQFVLCYETVLEWIWRVEEYGSNGASIVKGRGRSGSLAF